MRCNEASEGPNMMIPFPYVDEQGDRHEQRDKLKRLDRKEDWYLYAECFNSRWRNTDGFWSHGEGLADGEEGRRAGGRWVPEADVVERWMEPYR